MRTASPFASGPASIGPSVFPSDQAARHFPGKKPGVTKRCAKCGKAKEAAAVSPESFAFSVLS